MDLAFEKAAISVRSHGLHDAHVDVRVKVMHEPFARDIGITSEAFEIVIEELLAKIRRQVRFGVVEQGSDVVMQRTAPASLIIDKERLPVAQHDVARLKITIEKVIA